MQSAPSIRHKTGSPRILVGSVGTWEAWSTTDWDRYFIIRGGVKAGDGWVVRASCRIYANCRRVCQIPSFHSTHLPQTPPEEMARGSPRLPHQAYPPRGIRHEHLGLKGPRRVDTAMVRQAEMSWAGSGRPRRITRRVEAQLCCIMLTVPATVSRRTLICSTR
jgi:hypothetical protein